MTLNLTETPRQGPMIHRCARSLPANLRFQLVSGLAVVSLLLTALPQPASAEQVALIKVDVGAVAEGYRVSKMMGVNVKNDDGETIGEINDFIVDKKKVLFAILEVGGFLGIGEHLVAVPYESLALNETGTEIRLPGATKAELEKLKEFTYP